MESFAARWWARLGLRVKNLSYFWYPLCCYCAKVDGTGSFGEREVHGDGGCVQLRHRVLGVALASLSI